MTNKAFYAYVKAAKKTETDPIKQEVNRAMYQFLFECGVSKDGVQGYIEAMTDRAGRDKKMTPAHAAHYGYLGKVFADEVMP